jgi:chemotaxis regulatin CheY-phosphate phosphatase CheZ
MARKRSTERPLNPTMAEEILALTERLRQFLPEFGMNDRADKIAKAAIEINDLEDLLANKRALLQERFERFVAEVKQEWPACEIERACGYRL